MNKSDYMSYRMIVCHECRQSGDDVGDDWRCLASNDDIDNCIDATVPWDDFGYVYGA